MINAFTILGAEPTDTAERLQELLDEKELLLDYISEVQAAYADLTNPKKRIQHEIIFFRKNIFTPFNELVSRSYAKAPTPKRAAEIIICTGAWFEEDDWDLFDEINNSRLVSGITQIESMEAMSAIVGEIKTECIQFANAFFDGLTQKSTIDIFNSIVKIDYFESFFVDELMCHYEIAMQEELSRRESSVNDSFDTIEKLCNQYIAGNALSPTIDIYVDKFDKILKEWDKIAQPLQVNTQRRGGQHSSSGKLVHDIRNRIVDLCNRSQENINGMLEDLSYLSENTFSLAKYNSAAYLHISRAIDAREKLPQQISDGVKLLNIVLKLTAILSDVFAELENTAEQLKDDRKTLIELRSSLRSLDNQIKEAKNNETKRIEYTKQQAKNEEQTAKSYRIIHGILTAVCLIIMIICFALESIGAGVAFVVMTLAFGSCCLFYHSLEDRGIMKWIIIISIVLAVLIGGAIS